MQTSRNLIKPATAEQLTNLARDFNFSIEQEELSNYLALVNGTLAACEVLAQIPGLQVFDFADESKIMFLKLSFREPQADFQVQKRTKIMLGNPSGKLAGKRIALKDNICLAGVPMMNGSATLEGYVPDVDATIVTRMLKEGATIIGKVHCEDLCFSGGSHTGAHGPVHNPHKHGYSSGGSSSGSAVVVATKEADMTIGGDQGGSIRIPSSFCGTIGMKPTYGLVPYSGIFSIERTIDHTGPITSTVSDNALLLEVLAGEDGLDSRQHIDSTIKFNYMEYLDRGVKGMKIAVLKEGFEKAEKDVSESVKAAVKHFEKLGAEVEEVSVPMHALGHAIWLGVTMEGAAEQMMFGNSVGTGFKGLHVTSLVDTFSGWPQKADQLADTVKVTVLAGQYLKKHYHGHYHAKASNLVRLLAEAYNKVLSSYDVIVMPTLPVKATPIPSPSEPRTVYITRAFEMIGNTCPFNVTGHPALSIPCDKKEGLPVGMMIVGKHFEEGKIYQVARAFEKEANVGEIMKINV